MLSIYFRFGRKQVPCSIKITMNGRGYCGTPCTWPIKMCCETVELYWTQMWNESVMEIPFPCRKVCALCWMWVASKRGKSQSSDTILPFRSVSCGHYFRSGMVSGGCSCHEYLRCQGNTIRWDPFRWRRCTKAIGGQHASESRCTRPNVDRCDQSIRMEIVHHSVSIAVMAAAHLSPSWNK